MRGQEVWGGGITADEVARLTLERAGQECPDLAAKRTDRESDIELLFPTAAGSDYQFAASITNDLIDLQVAAKLLDPVLASSTDYFWYSPNERYGFASFEEHFDCFMEELLAVISHPTRIVQRKGIVSWNFCCEYLEGGVWKQIHGATAVRFRAFKVPPVTGKQRLFSAEPPRN